jgi:hypothetical protein
MVKLTARGGVLLKKDILCPEAARPVLLDDPEKVYLTPRN